MEHKVDFRGQAGEYFGIWIVNILLSIVTLGIYSAWAKVRTRRYFYGNTFIDDHAFEYHATGKQILIGRIIVVAALAFYGFLSGISPIAASVLLIVYLALLPLLVVRGLRFARRVTSYRNVRFDFTGTYGGAFWAMIVLPIFNIFTLYLATPYVSRTIANFIATNSRYGDRPFELTMPVGPLYKVLAIAITTFIAFFFIAGFLLFSGPASPTDLTFDGIIKKPATVILSILFYILALGFIMAYRAVLRNTQFNHLTLNQRHSFGSSIAPLTYIWIFISNALITIITLGLMAPWAKIRMSRYLAKNTTLRAGGPLDEYASAVKSESGVIGDEFMDMEGIDVGLGA